MKSLLRSLCNVLLNRKSVAMATIVQGDGSTPRGPGSKLVADENGLLAGTVGGGLFEGLTVEACGRAIRNREAALLEFHLDGKLAAQSNLICGGHLQILVEPFTPDALPFFEKILAGLEQGGGLLLTSFSTGKARIISPEFTVRPVGAEPRRTFTDLRGNHGAEPIPEAQPEYDSLREMFFRDALPFARFWRKENFTFFAEPFEEPYRLIIAGGGHVSRPTAQIAVLAGFSVTVLDDREEFASAERFPWADATYLSPDFAGCFRNLAPSPHTLIAIITRGHAHDKTVLAQALSTKAGYIGMIGSRRKREAIYAALRAEGVSNAELARVHSPIGLAIGAETPEEIAVSIVAECIAYRRGCDVHQQV